MHMTLNMFVLCSQKYTINADQNGSLLVIFSNAEMLVFIVGKKKRYIVGLSAFMLIKNTKAFL